MSTPRASTRPELLMERRCKEGKNNRNVDSFLSKKFKPTCKEGKSMKSGSSGSLEMDWAGRLTCRDLFYFQQKIVFFLYETNIWGWSLLKVDAMWGVKGPTTWGKNAFFFI